METHDRLGRQRMKHREKNMETGKGETKSRTRDVLTRQEREHGDTRTHLRRPRPQREQTPTTGN